jgi:hypothetical protein
MRGAASKSPADFNTVCVGVFQKIEDFEGGGSYYVQSHLLLG